MPLTKILIILGLIVVVVVAFLSWRLYFRFLPQFFQESIIISLPFAKEDDRVLFINPMGETDHHAPPRGHPGLDFSWDYPAPIRASASGVVTKIEEHPPGGFGETEKIYDIQISTGSFALRYTEIKPRDGLKEGIEVRKGEVIGRGGEYKHGDDGKFHYSMHWEFDYDSFITDRLCPLTYFDPDSLSRINRLWDTVGTTFGGRFPEICSGFYKGRDHI